MELWQDLGPPSLALSPGPFLVPTGEEGGYRGFLERKLGRGIAFEMLMKKISNKNKQTKQSNKQNNPSDIFLFVET